MADARQQICQGIVTILAASAAVQAIVGRATDLIRQRSGSIGVAPMPMLLYDVVGFEEGSGDGRLLLSVVDEGTLADPNAAADCNEILRTAVDALDYLAFAAIGLEVVTFPPSRQSVENDPDAPGSVNREGQPLLQQADALVPLLYLP